jgi:hypothetical protein
MMTKHNRKHFRMLSDFFLQLFEALSDFLWVSVGLMKKIRSGEMCDWCLVSITFSLILSSFEKPFRKYQIVL